MANQRSPRDKASRINRADDVDNGSSLFGVKTFMIVLAISALFVSIYIQVAKNISESYNKYRLASNQDDTLVIADNIDAGYLDHVIGGLLNYGHKLSFKATSASIERGELDQYDLIWTHDYPFTNIVKLDPRQRINHFPGNGFITNKMTLSTTPRIPHVLKAFRLPADKNRFLDYVKDNPNKMWVQKSSSHRGISIKTAEAVDLELKDTLVQEYMSNPLLIDGKKFDIGIYTVITSVEPLRLYIYDAESLLRFCADPYINKKTGEFNSSNLDSYVVGDDYTPIWLMPSLVRYYVGANLSMKQTLNTYLKRFDKNGQKIWDQIEETIKKVVKMKESHIGRMSRMYQEANNYNSTSVEGSLNQFFELVRFDFIVDQDLNVFLMEANMSPNLSSRHFPPNRLLYEQVLNSYLSLVGVTQFAQEHFTDLPVQYLDGSRAIPRDRIKQKSKNRGDERYGLDGVMSDKDISVYEELCVSDECHMNCHKTDCKLCYFCLSYEDKLHIRRALYENHSKWNFKRLLPSTKDEDIDLQLLHPETQQETIDANYIHAQWFRGKCFTDNRFCN